MELLLLAKVHCPEMGQLTAISKDTPSGWGQAAQKVDLSGAPVALLHPDMYGGCISFIHIAVGTY